VSLKFFQDFFGQILEFLRSCFLSEFLSDFLSEEGSFEELEFCFVEKDLVTEFRNEGLLTEFLNQDFLEEDLEWIYKI